MPKYTVPAAGEAMTASHNRSRSTFSKQNEALSAIARDAVNSQKTFLGLTDFLKKEMEELHGIPFRVVIDHETPMIFIRTV